MPYRRQRNIYHLQIYVTRIYVVDLLLSKICHGVKSIGGIVFNRASVEWVIMVYMSHIIPTLSAALWQQGRVTDVTAM